MRDVENENVLEPTSLLDLPPCIPLASGEGYSNTKFEEGAEFVFSIEPEGEEQEVRVWDVKIVKIGLPGDYIHVGNYGGYYNIDPSKMSNSGKDEALIATRTHINRLTLSSQQQQKGCRVFIN